MIHWSKTWSQKIKKGSGSLWGPAHMQPLHAHHICVRPKIPRGGFSGPGAQCLMCQPVQGLTTRPTETPPWKPLRSLMQQCRPQQGTLRIHLLPVPCMCCEVI